MSSPKGADLGGIRTLEGLRVRCYCDPDTGCWRWRGAFSKRHERGLAEPRVWLADRNVGTTLGRAAWELAKGAPLPKGKTVWRRCLSEDCGNPKHLMMGTKKQWGAWVASRGYLRGRPERSLINRNIKIQSGQTRLTLELATWVRESSQTGVAVAHALGESTQVVSRIRTGKAWKPPAQNSVFSWAKAATA
jgi:hypothetical protein